MSELRKAATAILAAILTAVLVGIAPAASASSTDPGGPSPGVDRLLERPAHGAGAVARLGDDIAVAARLNSMTVTELKRLLLRDPTAWVHPTGLVYYVDPGPDTIRPEPTPRAPYPYDQTFQLHSRPGSSKTIYLDFDGQTVSGSAFNTTPYLLPAGTFPAFSLDGDAGTFSNAERDLVQSVWQRVSEDYAPFDVDVTTADPGIEALRRTSSADMVYGSRALITPSTLASTTLCGGAQCGGVGFNGVFDWTPNSDYYQPAWIFPHNLSDDTKAIAEAVSHEVGHNLGLSHDGVPGQPYFPGHGAWAPIMGGGFDRPIVQWSRGEYADATNTEDDFAVITGHGLSFMADDHGDNIAGATNVTSGDRTAAGLIHSRADKDYFGFSQGCSGDITVTVTPAPTSPNLDVQLRLLSPSGTVLATANPPSAMTDRDTATGLGAAATVPVTAGTTLYAEVDGVGTGNPVTDGYSDYGSVGRYTISSTGCAGQVVGFQSATQSASEGAGTVQLTVTRTGNTTSTATVHYARTAGTATPGADFTLPDGDLTFTAGQTTKTIPVSIVQDTTPEPDETVQVTLSSPSTGTTLGTSVSTLTITDDDVAGPGAQPDALISTHVRRGYIGNDIYNDDARGQTITRTAHRGELRTFYVAVTNDGTSTDAFTVWGSKPLKGSTVRYVDMSTGADITAALTSAQGITVDIPPDEYGLIRADVRITRRAAIGSKKPMVVWAQSDGGGQTLVDVVLGLVKVVRG